MSIKMISGELDINNKNLTKGCVTIKFSPEGTGGATIEGPATVRNIKEVDAFAVFEDKPIAIVVPTQFDKPSSGFFSFFTDIFSSKPELTLDDEYKLEKVAKLLEGQEYALEIHTTKDQAKICWASIEDKGISEIQFMFLGEGGTKGMHIEDNTPSSLETTKLIEFHQVQPVTLL